MKIAVAMSGGVDSTITALILKENGYEVVGVYFKMLNFKNAHVEKKLSKISEKIGIDVQIVDVQEDFRREVIEYFKECYKRGGTPNPCAICNKKIKMRHLRKFAREIGAEFWASGHYARAKNGSILKARDTRKDQSYFLALVKKEDLAKLILPLGEFSKVEVKKIARAHGLDFGEKESQDVCFVREGLKNFFESEGVNVKKGRVIDEDGKELGEHKGYQLYTVGQRKGLGIAIGERTYVISIDVKNNSVIVGRREMALSKKFTLEQVNLHFSLSGKVRCECKMRSTGKSVPCTVDFGKVTTVECEESVLAVPGQVTAFYNGETLLGGGIIAQTRLKSK